MTFSKTPPTTPGDFAWKQDASDEEYVLAQVRTVDDVLLDESSGLPPAEVGGLWCRLVPAEEVVNAFNEGWANREQRSGMKATREIWWAHSSARLVVEGTA